MQKMYIFLPDRREKYYTAVKFLTGFFSTFPAFAKELFESVLTKIFAGLLFTRQQALHSNNITYFARQTSQIFLLQKKRPHLDEASDPTGSLKKEKNANNPKIQSVTRRCLF